jgi:hypothetical protein
MNKLGFRGTADFLSSTQMLNNLFQVSAPNEWQLLSPFNPLRICWWLDGNGNAGAGDILYIIARTGGPAPSWNPPTTSYSAVFFDPFTWPMHGPAACMASWVWTDGVPQWFSWGEVLLTGDPCSKSANLKPNANADDVWGNMQQDSNGYYSTLINRLKQGGGIELPTAIDTGE